jgi:hypothetical protein
MDKAGISLFIEDAYKKERSVKITPRSVLPRRQYDERLVAWIDVLGMRSRIRDFQGHDAEEILNTGEISARSIIAKIQCKFDKSNMASKENRAMCRKNNGEKNGCLTKILLKSKTTY